MTKVERLMEAYFNVFGENYPLSVADNKTNDEIIADIKRCIESGKPAPKPEYNADTDN